MLVTDAMLKELTADHPPHDYASGEPWKRNIFAFQPQLKVWGRAGDVYKPGIIHYREATVIAVRLEGEDQDRRYQYDSDRIWLRTK